jgi:hypothetical protein
MEKFQIFFFQNCKKSDELPAETALITAFEVIFVHSQSADDKRQNEN